MNTPFFNIIWHSLAFLFIFTSYNTIAALVQRVLLDYQKETALSQTPFTGIDGYLSCVLVYLTYGISNWLAPMFIKKFSARFSMLIGSIFYITYLLAFIYPNTTILWIFSILLGFGAALVWTGQGVFLSINSNDKNIDRNSSIFFTIENSTMIWGNIYLFYIWKGADRITSEIRIPFFIIFSVIMAIGSVLLVFLRKWPIEEKESNAVDDDEIKPIKTNIDKITSNSYSSSSFDAFKQALLLVTTPNMLKNWIPFFCAGISQTFVTVVFPTMVGHCKTFGTDSDRLIGIVMIVSGFGMVLGSSIWTPINRMVLKNDKSTPLFSRRCIINIGTLAFLIASVLICTLMPEDSPIKTTEKNTGNVKIFSLFSTKQVTFPLACLMMFLISFADSCLRVQILTYIGWYYQKLPAPGFAIYHSLRSIFCGISFMYAKQVLWIQILILVLVYIAAAGCFYNLEHEKKMGEKKEKEGETKVPELELLEKLKI